jgi:hypothetical protein
VRLVLTSEVRFDDQEKQHKLHQTTSLLSNSGKQHH